MAADQVANVAAKKGSHAPVAVVEAQAANVAAADLIIFQNISNN